MSQDVPVSTAVVAVKTLTLLLGGLVTYMAYKAYRRTGQPPLRTLSVGFGIITLGSLLAGVSDVVVGADILVSVLVESLLILCGFAVITYSMYMD